MRTPRTVKKLIGHLISCRFALASAFERDPQAPIPRAIKPGTRLIREWQGKSYKVTAAKSGFEYDGQWYASLSEIARLITGTRWSPILSHIECA